jgi:1-deoxy-D-xylulose-5-phosphate synthase
MLEKIIKPDDIKRLSYKDLNELAEEVRQRIIEVTSTNGGHVASSLGATDFIIALLKVFDLNTDKIIFDVGHQSYAYKILTERNDRFDTLRTYKGLGGFNNIFESEYDAFTVGHASTSISAALGIEIAKTHFNKQGKTIAVIGDGALTGGMAFEAMNHAGHLRKKLIVILNDNEMSISANVGALHNYLTNMLVSKSYNSIKKQVWDISQSLPEKIRSTFIYASQKMEGSLKNIIVPNFFFEALGFQYVGPVDGHDIPRMCRIFRNINDNVHKPIIIHLATTKGKGVYYAEQNSSKFHGVGPFDHNTGVTNGSNATSWSDVFGNKLIELANNNDKIYAITAAMKDGTGLNNFAEIFQNRFIDVGIAEQHAVTLSAGMALNGLKPFVAIYSTFLQRSIDQIIHDVALQKLPVVFCIDRSGIVGEDGATHQGVFDLSYLQFIPNLVIISPVNSYELENAMEWASSVTDAPIAIRYPRGIAHKESDRNNEKFTPFNANVIHRGKKIAISGVGSAFNIAEKVYLFIKNESIDFEPYLINPLFIKPYNKEIYDDVYENCDFHFIIEDNAEIGGFASRLALDYATYNCKTIPFGIPDEFIEHGNIDVLRDKYNINAVKIAQKIKPIITSFYGY